jgi:hypothetical protein
VEKRKVDMIYNSEVKDSHMQVEDVYMRVADEQTEDERH